MRAYRATPSRPVRRAASIALYASIVPTACGEASAAEPEDTGGTPAWLDEAVEKERRREADREHQQAQYERNIYAVQVGFGREIVKTEDEIHGYSGRAEFAMLIPSEDGASPLFALHVGLSGWGSGDEDRNGETPWGFGMPASFGYGYRTPWIIGYGGLSFGIGLDSGAEAAAGAYGFFGNLGVDLMGVRVLADTRAEYRIMKAGDSRWHLTYGGLLSLNL